MRQRIKLMNIPIFVKMVGIIVLAIVLTSSALFFTTIHYVSKWFDEESAKSLEHYHSAVVQEIGQLQNTMNRTANFIARDYDLITAIDIRSMRDLNIYAKEILDVGGVDFVTIADQNGVVLARGHSDLTGDSILYQHGIQQALLGKPTVGVETGTVVGFSIRAGYPVKIYGRLVGVVTLGASLSSSEFVDSVKNRLGVDAAIFQGDTCLATTIIRDGQLMAGSKMDNPAILESVQGRGQMFFGRDRILGRNYDAVYWPIIDVEGHAAGMYFIGQDRQIVEQARSKILMSILVVSLLVGAAMTAAGTLLARTLTGPIARATRYATRVAQGEMDAGLDIDTKDEIGILARSLNIMVANLKAQIQQSETKTREAEKMALEIKTAAEERETLQTQLLQSQKMEALGALAGGVAHDFNNLLQALNSNIQLLLMNRSNDHDDTKRLHSMAKSIDRAAQLVRQLLLFSRKEQPHRQRTSLNHHVEEVVGMLRRTIPRMIDVEMRLDSGVWDINADPAQVEQVLLNLGGNAADAMPDGGLLTIETSNVPPDSEFVKTHLGTSSGKFVLLCVTDTGRGMDEKTLSRVFNPFFTTKESEQGSGLGLAAVYGIVKNHGGDIRCYSEPDQGTTFLIYWPASTCLADDDNADPAARTRDQEPRGGTETILVVDDEEDIREVTAEVLESYGYTVISASSGEEALSVYGERGLDIDMVVLDLNMPGMGGRQCLRKLLEQNPDARVLIASGYAAAGPGRKNEEQGAAGFIGKPYQIDDLLTAVRKVLTRRAGEEKCRNP